MKRLNTKLLIWLLGGSLVLVVGVHFLHAFQINRSADSIRRQAEDAKQKGDLEEAAKKYVTYVKQTDDREGWAALCTLLADLAEKPEATRQDILVTFKTLEEAVRRYDDLHDVRRRLIDFTMKIQMQRWYRDAMAHIELLRERGIKDPSLDVKYARCQIAGGELEPARRQLAKLVGFDLAKKKFVPNTATAPSEVDAYGMLAGLALQSRDKNDVKVADDVMNQMVTANPKAHKAYLSRGNYHREKQEVEAAIKDFEQALKLAPDDASAILSMADTELQRKDFAKAKTLLDQGVKKHPKNELMYRAQALLAFSQGQRDEAVKRLQAGVKAVPNSMQLRPMLAEIQLQLKDVKGARETIEQMRKNNNDPIQADFLTAKLMCDEEKWMEALPNLERLRPLMGKNLPAVVQIDTLLGATYLKLGQPDKAADAFRRILDLDPSSQRAKVGLAQALVNQGKTKDIEKIAGTGDMPRSIAGRLLLGKIIAQMQRPKEKRDWVEIDKLTQDLLKDKSLSKAQVQILQAEVFLLREEPDRALKFVEAAKKIDPKELSVWIAHANVLIKQSALQSNREAKYKELEDLLTTARANVGDALQLRLLELNIAARKGKDHLKAALPKLEQGLDKFPAFDRAEYLSALTHSYRSLKDYDGAKRSLRKAIDAQPSDLQRRQTLFDLAREYEDEPGMAEALAMIGKAAGTNDASYKYCRASLVSWKVRKNKAPRSELEVARKDLDAAAHQRPDWSAVPLLGAEIDSFDNDVDGEIKNLAKAIEIGAANPQAARRLVYLYFAKNEFDKAREYVHLVGDPPADDPIRKIAVVLQSEKDPEGAIATAKANIAADPKNEKTYLFLGQLLDRQKRYGEAADVYRKGATQNPKNSVLWLNLVNNLITNKKKTEARETIEKARGLLPEDQVASFAAQAYELLGDADLAEKNYLAAVKSKPDSIARLRGIAMYYMRTSKSDKALPFVDKILEKSKVATRKEAPDLAWARRAKAQMLGSGSYQDLKQALELLKQNAESGQQFLEDMVLEAGLLAPRQDVASRQRAIELMELVRRQRPLNSEERLMLAQLYESRDRWTTARAEMLDLVGHEDRPQFILAFAQMLLRHNDLQGAERQVTRLKELQPNELTTLEVEARLLVKQGHKDEAIKLLRGVIDRPLPPDQLNRFASVAGLLESLEQYAPAEQAWRELKAREPRWTLALGAFVGRRGRVDEAFVLYEEARKSQPLDIIVQSAINTLRLNVREADPKYFAKVEQWIQSVAADDPDPLKARLQLAELKDVQGKTAEVTKLYREVLARPDLKPQQQAIVKNNLAFVLAFGGPDQATEALRLSNEAIAILGPSSDLLDTRALAFLGQGTVQSALQDLREAVADSPTANKYFHLAYAQHLAQDNEGARKSLTKAKELKLDPERLSTPEKKALDQLKSNLGVR